MIIDSRENRNFGEILIFQSVCLYYSLARCLSQHLLRPLLYDDIFSIFCVYSLVWLDSFTTKFSSKNDTMMTLNYRNIWHLFSVYFLFCRLFVLWRTHLFSVTQHLLPPAHELRSASHPQSADRSLIHTSTSDQPPIVPLRSCNSRWMCFTRLNLRPW